MLAPAVPGEIPQPQDGSWRGGGSVLGCSWGSRASGSPSSGGVGNGAGEGSHALHSMFSHALHSMFSLIPIFMCKYFSIYCIF